ncbi:MAG TPA: hypothetical protein VF230_11505 [Acidimicrobiales bacterium]
MLRRLSVVAVALALVGATAASAQGSAQESAQGTGLGIRLLEAPAAKADDPRARSYIVDHVTPGQSISRKIEVSNDTGRTGRVSLYAGPATVDDGSFTYGEPGSTSDLTTWVSVVPTALDLADGAAGTANVTIDVPASARPGERYGVVWAEIPGIAPPGGGVTLNSRVGIRIYLSVGQGAEPETDFELTSFRPVRAGDGSPAIEIDVCNRGGRAVDLTGSVRFYEGPGGTSAGPFATPTTTTLAPGACGVVVVPLDPELPLGPWRASATLRSGLREETAQATITLPPEDQRVGRTVPAERVTDSVGGRLAILLALALLLVVLLLAYLAWRRANARKKAAESATATAA